jgi:hypothetical protein
MASLQEKLRDGAQPFLEPGERFVTAFSAQTGPNPYWLGIFGPLAAVFGAKYWLIVVTEDSILRLQSGSVSAAKPRGLEKRVPREDLVLEGKVWGSVTIDGERHWVHTRFRKDVEATG